MDATHASGGRALSTNGDSLLTVKDVCLTLGDNRILDKLAFQVIDRIRPGVTTGQIVALLGPSGIGKTRLLRLLAGLDVPDTGSITGPKNAPVEAGKVGVVFQDYPLLRHRTVQSNLTVAGMIAGMSHADAQARGRKLLEKFGLADRASFYPGRLSGGQRQRVAIAQQLVVPKQLLCMDEPFSGLDPAALDEVIEMLVGVANLDELNTIVIVTHDVHSAMLISDTVFMLGRDRAPDGKIIPGARIQSSYDMVERGFAWRKDLETDIAFGTLEQEIRAKFKQL